MYTGCKMNDSFPIKIAIAMKVVKASLISMQHACADYFKQISKHIRRQFLATSQSCDHMICW